MRIIFDFKAVPPVNLIRDHTGACSHAQISAEEFRDSMREIINELPVPLHWRAHQLVELCLELAHPCLYEECAGTLLFAGTFLAGRGGLSDAAQGLADACERIADKRDRAVSSAVELALSRHARAL